MSYGLPLLGGVIIGLAAILLLLGNGRIAGIGGIVWGAASAPAGSLWRWLFLLGMILGTYLFHQFSGQPAPVRGGDSLLLAGVAGLIVGFGVKLGNGCTSGHGVCGLGRLSLRSLVATVSFMLSGIATVAVVRHILGVA